MVFEFRLPDVGEGIAEAEIVEWYVQVGDSVEEGQALCEVETDKSIVEIPSPVTGMVQVLEAGEGEVVPVDQIFIVFELEDDESDPAPTGALPPVAEESAAVMQVERARESDRVPLGSRPKASPRTRRLAAERGINLRAITGTGPHGRILESDLDQEQTSSEPAAAVAGRVEAAPLARPAERSAPTPRSQTREDVVVPLKGLRRRIAQAMSEALTIPHVTEFKEIDATNLLAAHRTLRGSLETQGVRFSLFPLLMRIVTRALALTPSMNATYNADEGVLTQHGDVNLGMATATDDGLIVPVIRNAGQLDLLQLAGEIERLAESARNRTASPEDLSGGTFTVTNFGSFGTWLGNPIIRPPEVGIAGFGRIEEKVIVVDGAPAVRPVLPLVVATDHRINDGIHLAEFIGSIVEAIEEPTLLLI